MIMLWYAQMKSTQVIQEFPGYYWQWDGFYWTMMWEPVRNWYSPPCLHPGIVKQDLPVPLELHDKIGLLIGHKGQNFIRVTAKTGCCYIFYLSTQNKIEVWGEPQSVVSATRKLKATIHKLLSNPH